MSCVFDVFAKGIESHDADRFGLRMEREMPEMSGKDFDEPRLRDSRTRSKELRRSAPGLHVIHAAYGALRNIENV